MSQFQLCRQVAKIDSFNPRAEKHGDENVPAGDIKFTTTGHSSMLDAFNRGLRPLLYRKADLVGEQQALLEGDDLTALAMPNLKPLRLDEDYPGYRLEISEGLEFSRPIVMDDVELSGFVFEPAEGGSVKISFRAACHPDEEISGALCQLIQESPYITLVPPAAVSAPQLPLGGDGDTLDQQDADAEAKAEADRLAALGAAA